MAPRIFAGGGDQTDVGESSNLKRQVTPPDLDAIPYVEFLIHLRAWISRIWVHEHDVPLDLPDLARFDERTLIPRFRNTWTIGTFSRMERGNSLEELWLMQQLTHRQPFRLILNRAYADEDLGRVSRVRLHEAADVVATAYGFLRDLDIQGPKYMTVVMHERGAHCFMLAGVDWPTGCFQFVDPWAGTWGRSWLSPEVCGSIVSAVWSPRRPGMWLISPEELARVVVAVYIPEQDGMQRLMQSVLSGKAEPGPMAEGHMPRGPAFDAFDTGSRLENQGDLRGAQRAYEAAMSVSHPDVTPMAAVRLGRLMSNLGDGQRAKMRFQEAIDSRHEGMAPWAALQLGLLLERDGDVEGACRAYQDALDSGHIDMAHVAGAALGSLLIQSKDIGGARSAYERVLDSGEAALHTVGRNSVAEAGVMLASILHDQGDLRGERAALERVSWFSSPWVARAQLALGAVCETLDDLDSARAAYREVVLLRDRALSDLAARRLAELGSN